VTREARARALALEERTWVAVRPTPDGHIRLRSQQAAAAELELDEIAPARVQGWAAYVAGAAWAARAAGARASGFELLVDSDVPIGAGLSSSAALSCATVLALAELWGFEASRVDLARLAQRAETEIAGTPCGLMDQLTSLCAQPGCALAIDFQTLEIEPLQLPLASAELTLLVIDTRQPHALVEGAYRARRESCARAAELLGVESLREATLGGLAKAEARLGPEATRRARHVISENERVRAAISLLRAAARDGQSERLRELGPLLQRSHASLRDDFEVSVPALDVASASAEGAGALGARLVGGGFGGSVLALVPTLRVPAVSEAVTAAFLAEGWGAPRLLTAEAGAGAARVL
jgi:galactokinase